ncbi:LOW QUALITY PROTEIN: tripartite motif-containing protein 54, partial [Menidia menidia]
FGPVCLELFSKPVVILPCQHNLCRRCRPRLPVVQLRAAAPGLLLLFGLQRNLLVENILDIYRQQEHSRLLNRKPEQPTCEEHGEEKINICCLSCAKCSAATDTARWNSSAASTTHRRIRKCCVHVDEKPLKPERVSVHTKENGRSQREHLTGGFSRLTAVLDQRKQELVAIITTQQDQRLGRLRSLIGRYGDRLEAAITLVESTLQSMEEPHMCVFIQNATATLEKMAAMARSMAFCSDVGHEEEESEMDSGLRY